MRPGFLTTNINSFVRIVALVICWCSITAPALGQTDDVWVGGDGNWSYASMWSNGVPNNNSDVFIDDGNPIASTVQLDMNPTVASLTIDSKDNLVAGDPHTGGMFTLTASSVTNRGTLDSYGGLVVNAALANQGTIKAERHRTSPPVNPYVEIIGAFTNTGTVEPIRGGTITIEGPFSNFSGTTLTGGTYNVLSGTLQFTNANIVTNSAKIYLNGPSGLIVDQALNNGLRNFANNSRGAVFTLIGYLSLVVSTDFSNAGTVKVGSSGSFQVTSYTQTSGTTTINGSLTAPSGMTIKAGLLDGGGQIYPNVVSSGSITPAVEENGGNERFL